MNDFLNSNQSNGLELCPSGSFPVGHALKVEMRGSDGDFLRATEGPIFRSCAPEVRIVDLFCGAGGISLGLVEAASALGLQPTIRWAVDFEARALAVYSKNFPTANTELVDLASIFQADPEATELSATETKLAEVIGTIDILVGGPPCQGHSDLNNYSRRDDPKNGLYMVMARAARVLRPKMILIENVPGAKHDRGSAVERTAAALKNLGYHVVFDVINLREIGVPQSRRRLVMLASLEPIEKIQDISNRYTTSTRSVGWAIKELARKTGDDLMSTPSVPSAANKNRIDYLFDHKLHDLPDSQRPPCHSNGEHSYKSIYGRLKWDEPSQTITSGFYSMCMGRYVHPSQRRTLTAKEAARLQFFPDFFSFEPAGKRTAVAKIIGNAVPPKLSYVFGHFMMSELMESGGFK